MHLELDTFCCEIKNPSEENVKRESSNFNPQVAHHVSELHIEPRRRLEDRDLVIDYIESHGSQIAG